MLLPLVKEGQLLYLRFRIFIYFNQLSALLSVYFVLNFFSFKERKHQLLEMDNSCNVFTRTATTKVSKLGTTK